SFGTPGKLLPAFLAVAAVVEDFDRDGKKDVAVVTFTGQGTIYPGKGDGTFITDYQKMKQFIQGGSYTYFVATGDFNGDAMPDLVVTNAGGEVAEDLGQAAVLLNNGDGSMGLPVLIPAGDYPLAVVVADFNRDGFQDFAVANSGSSDVTVHLGNGHGEFAPPRRYPSGDYPIWIASADLNGDGAVDLVVAHHGRYVPAS